MTAARGSQWQQEEPQHHGVCAAHEHFEARMDERVDSLKESIERLADAMADMAKDIKEIKDRLGDGSVSFARMDGRVQALERNADHCAKDRDKMKCDIKFLTRGYWIAIGALMALQFIMHYWK